MTERLTFTVVEMSKLLGISRNLAYERVRTGELPSIRCGRRILVPRTALLALLQGANAGRSSPETRFQEPTHAERRE